MFIKNKNRGEENTAFLDLLFITLLFVLVINILQNYLIKIEESKANIKTHAEFVITLTWEKDNTDDIDIWVEDPLENVVHFRNKEVGLMHLDRDDIGYVNDQIILPDGSKVAYAYNQEILTIRGFIPGEWTLNIHMYNKREKEPTEAQVKIEKLNPQNKIIFFKTFKLKRVWQEITVTRFTMTSSGEFLNWNNLSKSLVPDDFKPIRNENINGGFR